MSTIACGILKFSLLILIGCSIITRSVRFFAVSYVFKRFGPQIAPVIEKALKLVKPPPPELA